VNVTSTILPWRKRSWWRYWWRKRSWWRYWWRKRSWGRWWWWWGRNWL